MDNRDPARTVLAVTGADAVHFLQGILTQDVTKLATDKIQFAALLSPQGKILHDMFLIDAGETILLDTPTPYAETLRKRLAMYKLRAKVTIADTEIHVGYAATGGLPDPRHPALPQRLYDSPGTIAADDYHIARLALGVPDSIHDFAPDEVTALDAGYDLLHAVSFTKGCYVGQEVTARMHYKNIARRGFFILEENGIPARLALLKFDAMEAAEGTVTLDGIAYHARLPDWMTPKWALHSG